MASKENILREFNFLLFSLKDKTHEFSYHVQDLFFEQFEDSLIENGDFDVNIVLIKSETLLQFDFDIKGKTQLICDRSLEEFEYPMEVHSKMVFKFGEAFEEVSDELIILAQGTSELNIASWLYELIAVHIPFKKLHPKFVKEVSDDDFFDDDDEEELEFVYSDETESSEEEEQEEGPNEMWGELKKKFNKNK